MTGNPPIGDALDVEAAVGGDLAPLVDGDVTDAEQLGKSCDAADEIGRAAHDGEKLFGSAIDHDGTDDNLRFRNLSTCFPYRLLDGLGQHTDMKTFAERLDWAMRRRNLNPGKLGKAIGISREAVGKWLKKEGAPQEHRWPKLAEVLGVSVVWLRDGVGDPDAIPAGIDSPRTLDPRTVALAAAVNNAAAAGEFGLAADAAELLARAYREIDARKQGTAEQDMTPGRKRG